MLPGGCEILQPAPAPFVGGDEGGSFNLHVFPSLWSVGVGVDEVAVKLDGPVGTLGV